MKSRSSHSVQMVAHSSVDHRSGATLTEVLMAILIMSIGIVSVCALFPVAIVSSIRATQLTNGKILKDNVKELVHTIPELLAPPIGGSAWKGQWRPNTQYANGDYIIPKLTSGALFPNPYYALICTSAGQSGPTEPIWTTTLPTYSDGTAEWAVVPIPNYVIDPYGYFRSSVSDPGLMGDLSGQISASNVSNLPLRTPSPAGFPPGGEAVATAFFASPDSWSVSAQEMPISISGAGTTITFPSSVNVDGISTDPRFSRVIFSTPDGAHSLVRFPAAGSAGSTLEITQPIPAAFTGPARLETFTPRYTYFLTVRNNGADAAPTLSCAIVFNRQMTGVAEHAYMANFGNSQFSSVASVANGSLMQDQVQIAWDSTEPDPFLKVGAYLLDTRALVFYRIAAVSKSGDQATVTLNRPVESLTTNNSATQSDLAIVIPGILHVYYIQ